VFGLQQAWVPKVKICSDCPSGPEKTQICSDWPIRPRKWPIFVWTSHPASKNGSYSPQTTIRQLSEHTESCLSHSASIPSALLTSPDFLRPFLVHMCPYNSFYSFQNILKLCLQLVEHLDFRVIEIEHPAIVVECGCYG
jgi:hypothetical protein